MTAHATLIVFDVGKGDHLLLRVEDGEDRFHAVIDCYWPEQEGPAPALRQLENWGVERLDLLALTHPHFDHYLGLARVAEAFGSEPRRLGRYVDPGLDLLLLAERANGIAAEDLRRLHSATYGRRGLPMAPECLTFRKMALARSATPNSTVVAVAPTLDVCREAHDRLLQGKLVWTLLEAKLLLGGDLEEDGWLEILDRCQVEGIDLRSDVVKVSHHGSVRGCPKEAWQRLTRKEESRSTHAAISTAGTTKHPGPDVLRAVLSEGGHPRCTNYGPVCEPFMPGPARKAALRSLGIATTAATPRSAALNSLGARPIEDRRCFGSIRLDVSGEGQLTVTGDVAAAACHLEPAWLSGRWS